jgi:hypothetical protein
MGRLANKINPQCDQTAKQNTPHFIDRVMLANRIE